MLDPDISTADALRHLQRRRRRDPFALDRRRFLQLIGMGVGAGVVASHGGSLLNLDLPGLDPTAWAAGPIGSNDGILIVIGMYGGNDGLNTVVPFNDGELPPAARNAGDLRRDRRCRSMPTPGCTPSSPSSSGSGTPANSRSSRASATRIPT